MQEIPSGLRDADTQVQDALRRVDAKATTLLTAFSAALAGTIALATSRLGGVAAVLVWIALVPIGAAVTLVLLTIQPKLNNSPVPGTWLHAAEAGPATVLEAYVGDVTDSMALAEHVCVLARIARTKYRRVRVAVGLLLAGLAPLVASVLITVVS